MSPKLTKAEMADTRHTKQIDGLHVLSNKHTFVQLLLLKLTLRKIPDADSVNYYFKDICSLTSCERFHRTTQTFSQHSQVKLRDTIISVCTRPFNDFQRLTKSHFSPLKIGSHPRWFTYRDMWAQFPTRTLVSYVNHRPVRFPLRLPLRRNRDYETRHWTRGAFPHSRPH